MGFAPRFCGSDIAPSKGMSRWLSAIVAVAAVSMMCLAVEASAQGGHETGPSVPTLALDAAADALRDPTTYLPAGMLYVSARLDWNSSQVFFQQGALENNPRFTVSGLPHDVPVSYGTGNRLILIDALSVASVSLANNALAHFAVRFLTIRTPEHRTRWKTLGWIERTLVASSLSYALSVQHFRQWQLNEQRAAALGNSSAGIQ
jgi:hypothetical protein